MANHWIIVGSPGNVAKSRELGWTVQGISVAPDWLKADG